MGIGSVDLWLAGDLRMGKCVYGHHVAVDLLRQRSSPLEPHAKNWPFRDVHERPWPYSGSPSALNAPQTASHWLLLRFDVASQRSIGARVVLARLRKSSCVHDPH